MTATGRSTFATESSALKMAYDLFYVDHLRALRLKMADNEEEKTQIEKVWFTLLDRLSYLTQDLRNGKISQEEHDIAEQELFIRYVED